MTMSLRLSEDAIRGVYPPQSIHAGEPIVPLGFNPKTGRPVWPIMGGAPDPDDDEDNDTDEDEDEDEDSDEEDEDSDEDEDENGDDGPEGKKSKKQKRDDSPEGLKRKISALEDEKQRLYRGRQKAREERDDLQEKLDKLKKDGVTDDSVKTENAELTKSNTKLAEKNQELRLQVAFLSDNTYEWQNPGLALRAVDLSDVEIDDDGKVMGMTSALQKLAEDNPYLLKQKEKPKKRTQSSERKSGSTGQRPAKKTTSKTAAERQRVKEKYRIGG